MCPNGLSMARELKNSSDCSCQEILYSRHNDMYIVYTCMYIVWPCILQVYTIMYNMLNVYTKCIQACTMFNHVYTLSNTYIQGYNTRFWPDKQEIQKINKKYISRSWTNDLMHTSKLPWPLCYQRDWQWAIIASYIYIVTCRLMSHVWCRILCAPRHCGPPHWRHPPVYCCPASAMRTSNTTWLGPGQGSIYAVPGRIRVIT